MIEQTAECVWRKTASGKTWPGQESSIPMIVVIIIVIIIPMIVVIIISMIVVIIIVIIIVCRIAIAW